MGVPSSSSESAMSVSASSVLDLVLDLRLDLMLDLMLHMGLLLDISLQVQWLPVSVAASPFDPLDGASTLQARSFSKTAPSCCPTTPPHRLAHSCHVHCPQTGFAGMSEEDCRVTSCRCLTDTAWLGQKMTLPRAYTGAACWHSFLLMHLHQG